MRIHSNLAIRLVVVIAIGALAVAWAARSTRGGESTITECSTTGVFSLAQSEIARLHVVNILEKESISVNWACFDGQGRVLARSNQSSQIDPGKADFFDLGPLDLRPGEFLPVFCDTVVVSSRPSGVPTTCLPFTHVASVEVYRVNPMNPSDLSRLHTFATAAYLPKQQCVPKK